MNYHKSREGTALPEYILIAVLFALTLGLAIFQMSPDVITTYFEKSVDENATISGGNLKMTVMGE